MTIEVVGYNAFKDTVDALGGSPTVVLYAQAFGAGTITSALAVVAGQTVWTKFVNNTTTNFLTEYPSALEVAFYVKGS